MALIELDGVTKVFRIPKQRRDTVREHALALFRPRPYEELVALDNISLTLERGESLGIMGKNGSGKSTLLRVLCNVYQPTTGRVSVRGTITPLLQLGVGWSPELNAIDNLLLVGTLMGMRLEQIHNALDEILAFAGVERFAELELKHYSSGMAERLAYAMAFYAVRDILVIDEVLAVGDAGFKSRCEQRFRELDASGHTTIMASHSPGHVREHCRHAVLIEAGRLSASGTGEEIADLYMERMEHHRQDAL